MEAGAIYITRWGTSGPKVIMVHGGAQGGTGGEYNFEVQAALAERGYQVIVPDRPGHGRSADPGRPDDAALDAVWLADMLGDGAHLVGHSFGGCVALAATAMRPEAVRSLTFIEPAMLGLATHVANVRRLLFRLLAAKYFSLSAESRATRSMAILGIPTEKIGGLEPGQLKRQGKGLAQIRMPSKAILHRELTEVKRAGIPLLVVTGGWSPAFEAASDVVASLGGGRRAVIQSEHHFPQRVSDEFNQIFVAFMEQSDATSATRHDPHRS